MPPRRRAAFISYSAPEPRQMGAQAVPVTRLISWRVNVNGVGAPPVAPL
jgi:hypothetical protein